MIIQSVQYKRIRVVLCKRAHFGCRHYRCVMYIILPDECLTVKKLGQVLDLLSKTPAYKSSDIYISLFFFFFQSITSLHSYFYDSLLTYSHNNTWTFSELPVKHQSFKLYRRWDGIELRKQKKEPFYSIPSSEPLHVFSYKSKRVLIKKVGVQ